MFTPTGAMAAARYGHSATVLPDGRVLIVGGTSDGTRPLASAESIRPGHRDVHADRSADRGRSRPRGGPPAERTRPASPVGQGTRTSRSERRALRPGDRYLHIERARDERLASAVGERLPTRSARARLPSLPPPPRRLGQLTAVERRAVVATQPGQRAGKASPPPKGLKISRARRFAAANSVIGQDPVGVELRESPKPVGERRRRWLAPAQGARRLVGPADRAPRSHWGSGARGGGTVGDGRTTWWPDGATPEHQPEAARRASGRLGGELASSERRGRRLHVLDLCRCSGRSCRP